MRYSLGLALLFLLFISCEKPSIKPEQNTGVVNIPAAILIENEIEGEILGKQLTNPSGLALDSTGSIYVCDQGNNRIIKFSSGLVPVRETGGNGSQLGMYNKPSYIIFEDPRYLFVCDEGNHRIQKIDNNLNFVDAINVHDPEEPLKFGLLSGLATTSDGSIIAGDRERNRLIVLNNVNQFEQFMGDLGDAGGQLSVPSKVLVDKRDNIIVCDAGNSRLAVYDKSKLFVRSIIHPSMVYPVSCILQDNKTYWVLDGQVNCLFCFSRDGSILSQLPVPIYGSELTLSQPYDMLLLPDGRLLISDYGNDRIVVCKVIYNQTSNQ